jgi:hypothetical protein
MIVALAIIWVGFNFMSGGLFLTSRNLWNLSVQSSSIAVMATGMVLIIVSRNIDLSVGSILGLDRLRDGHGPGGLDPDHLGLGFDQPYTWIVALAVGIALGAAHRWLPGLHHRLRRGARLHRHPRRPARLARPRLRDPAGPDDLPMDKTFSMLGGGPTARSATWPSWIVGDRRVRGNRLHDDRQQPQASPCIRLPGPADVGDRSDHGRARASASSAPSGSPTATSGLPASPTSTPSRTTSSSRPAASRSRPASRSRL